MLGLRGAEAPDEEVRVRFCGALVGAEGGLDPEGVGAEGSWGIIIRRLETFEEMGMGTGEGLAVVEVLPVGVEAEVLAHGSAVGNWGGHDGGVVVEELDV